ncbi:MAG: hypothetical protein C0497_13285 [Gemmatimonas sp.]|nr:hypothetical protein [Gemmatimonas sp.]
MVSAAQPNPPGKDRATTLLGQTTELNDEWVELLAQSDVNVRGLKVLHREFGASCVPLRTGLYFEFGDWFLPAGCSVRIHTGHGSAYWEGTRAHVFAGHGWFKWNNVCGDRVSLASAQGVVDHAEYAPRSPEGPLVRRWGTNQLVPAMLPQAVRF